MSQCIRLAGSVKVVKKEMTATMRRLVWRLCGADE
jgi:hypothetical protein